MGKCASKVKSYWREKKNHHFNEILRGISFEWNEENCDIKAAVEEFVDMITKKISEIDPRLKIENSLLVGSMKEGTRVISPTEFDFQLVLGDFSQLGSVALLNDSREEHSTVHLKLLQPELKRNWKAGKFNDCLNVRKLRRIFEDVLGKALDECIKVEKTSGTLQLRVYDTFGPGRCDMYRRGPAFTVMLDWFKKNTQEILMEVFVDLCPVIKYNGPDKNLCPTYFDNRHHLDSIVLMPYCKKCIMSKFSQCLLFVYTSEELRLLSDMSDHHKNCYKLLKCILLKSGNRPFSRVFSSYVIKILVLDHHFVKECKEDADYGMCINTLLNEMIEICISARPSILGYDYYEVIWAHPFVANEMCLTTIVFYPDLNEEIMRLTSLKNPRHYAKRKEYHRFSSVSRYRQNSKILDMRGMLAVG